MPLPVGTRLGHYDVTARLGEGGMGEVYRARDTKLGRDVALKTLPESFTQDPERLARFRREAQILASLNHPHIAAIYDLAEIEGRHLLVLELVGGETLAARLHCGPLPADEALSLAREIALALEAAHERGIVHRDLKPGNIALTTDGVVKVLDFGLARATEPQSDGHPTDPVNSPTITSPLTLTALGVILGTAAYMSPEQARGAVADRRSDVWAFGCVLYEMLTGTRAFAGEDITETLASVVRGQPDWTLLPASLPAAIRALLEGCFEKDRRKRIGDISVARFVLERGPALTPAPSREPLQRLWGWMLLTLSVAVLGAAAGAYLLQEAPQIAPLTRFTIQLPQGQELGQTRRALTVSPDGTRIVYTADGRLFMRSISEFNAQPIFGTESGLQPAFAPDGQSIAFWAEGAIKRVSVAGGAPVRVCDTSPAPYGLDWTQQGIVFVEPGGGIMQVPPDGGTPSRLVPFKDVEGLMQGARLLPDGDTLLFTITLPAAQLNVWDAGQIVAQSLRSGERKVLIQGGSNPQYVPTGHLLYMVEGTLMGMRFDPATREVPVGPMPIVEGVWRVAPAAGGEGQFAVSATGTLAYIPGPARAGDEAVFLYGHDGSAELLKLQKGRYDHPRVSPDGQWVAFESHDGKEWLIAIYHLSGTTAVRRLTFGGNNRYPIWTRDSRRVVFQSDRDGERGVFWQSLKGGPAERLTSAEPGTSHVPESWSPIDDVLLYSVTRETTHSLWMLSVKGRQAAPFGDVTSIPFPTGAVFSPDGRWVAYQAGDGQTGEAITYVQPFPPTGTKYQIARGGRPLWSPDGTRLYFVPGPGRFMATTVTAANEAFAFTAPELVPRRFGLAPPGTPRTFDFVPNGRMIGINTPVESGSAAASQIHVVQNWFEELKAKVPVRP